MLTEKKPIPPEDVIREDSGPPVTEIKEPPKHPANSVEIDIDDAMIEEPKDEVFEEAGKAKPMPPS